MDSNDLERERGITILAKNTVGPLRRRTKINIVDTPGHADFGGEVERTLKMVDGVLLLVDASEGPLPQTRFVLRKALAARPAADRGDQQDRPRRTRAPARCSTRSTTCSSTSTPTEHQLDFPVFCTDARKGLCRRGIEGELGDLRPLFEAILAALPAPAGDPAAPLQLLVTNLDYSDYLGRLAVGRIVNGTLHASSTFSLAREDGIVRAKVGVVYTHEGSTRVEVERATAGDIVALAGLDEVSIGDSLVDPEDPRPLQRIAIDEPTMSMVFSANTSPFGGPRGAVRDLPPDPQPARAGGAPQRRHSPRDLRRTTPSRSSGRGELQLAILIETMRREGYELSVSKPEVVTREIDGRTHEPMEIVQVDCPEAYIGVVTQKLGTRRAR